ncbi:MAG: glycosyltransferase [Candidatus Eisenbacteria bacterium]
MSFVFWASLVLVAYAYAGYPALLLLLARRAGRPAPREERTPTVTVVVPVHNQPEEIRMKIENLLRLDYPRERLTVVISSDGSDDGTDEVVRGYEDRGIRLVRSGERRGKVHAQNRAIESLGGDRGEVVVFTDASILLNEGALRAIVRAFADPEVGCVSSDDDVPGGGEGLYVRYEMFLRRLEGRIKTLVGVSGSFYAVRGDLVAPTDPRFTRDFLVPLSIIGKGLRVQSDPEARGRFLPAPSSGSEFRRKVRTVMRGMDVLFHNARLLDPLRDPFVAWALLSHKVVRWLVPWAMLALFLASFALAGRPFYRVFFALQALFYLSAAAAARPGFWASSLPGKASLFFTVTNAAILVAWIRYLRGERAVVWEPTKR